MIVAPPEGGKTSYLLNLFSRDTRLLYQSFYHKIYIVSSHINESDQSKSADGYNILAARNPDQRYVLLEWMTEDRWAQIISTEKDVNRPSLVILDDQTGNEELMAFVCGRPHTAADGIIKTCSHSDNDHIHIWMVVHTFTGPAFKGFRDCAKHFTFFRNAVAKFPDTFIGRTGRQSVVVTYPRMKYSALFQKISSALSGSPHSFLFVNTLVDEIDHYNGNAVHDRTLYLDFSHQIFPQKHPMLQPLTGDRACPWGSTGGATTLVQFHQQNPLPAPVPQAPQPPPTTQELQASTTMEPMAQTFATPEGQAQLEAFSQDDLNLLEWSEQLLSPRSHSVRGMLKKYRLGPFATKLLTSGYDDLTLFPVLTQAELSDLGITRGHRLKWDRMCKELMANLSPGLIPSRAGLVPTPGYVREELASGVTSYVPVAIAAPIPPSSVPAAEVTEVTEIPDGSFHPLTEVTAQLQAMESPRKDGSPVRKKPRSPVPAQAQISDQIGPGLAKELQLLAAHNTSPSTKPPAGKDPAAVAKASAIAEEEQQQVEVATMQAAKELLKEVSTLRKKGWICPVPGCKQVFRKDGRDKSRYKIHVRQCKARAKAKGNGSFVAPSTSGLECEGCLQHFKNPGSYKRHQNACPAFKAQQALAKAAEASKKLDEEVPV